MSDIAIKVENLSKKYLLGTAASGNLRDTLAYNWNRLRGKEEKSQKKEFWALKDVSFEIKKGEVIGVIGRNGAGKSTLLKILSRITEPTSGRIELNGRVASLLEVGTGFHPELSGRENIFLNGALLGMTRAEIKQKFDEIIDFSGVEEFIDTPVKKYSSGMYVRLAFAVAAHLEPEILLVDEVLAVGDAEFQKKCLGKMDEVAKGGRTVVFVSHNMGTIQQLCKQGILVTNGKAIYYPNINNLLAEYTKISKEVQEIKFQGPLSSYIRLKDILINKQSVKKMNISIEQTKPLNIEIHLKILKEMPAFRATLSIYNQNGRLFSLHDLPPTHSPVGDIICHYEIPSHFLRPNSYRIGLGGLLSDEKSDWYWNDSICNFTILDIWDNTIERINHGFVNVKANTYRQKL